MSGKVIDEGFQFGGEFVCTAIPAAGIVISKFKGRCANEGFSVHDARSQQVPRPPGSSQPRDVGWQYWSDCMPDPSGSADDAWNA